MFVLVRILMSARVLFVALARMFFPRQQFLQRVFLSLAVFGWGTIALAQTATSTMLTVSPSTSPLAPKTVVTLTATVMAGGTAIQPGLVIFCDASIHAVPACSGLAVVGTAQLQSGANAGIAKVHVIPGGGSHSYVAVFAGTHTYATSTSASQAIAALSPTTSSITSSGSSGSYTLAGTVVGTGNFRAQTGNVSFVDTTIGNYVIGSAPLGASTLTQSFTAAPGFPVRTDGVPYAITTSDFNGDGKLDVAVTNNDTENVTILLGDGNGRLTPAPGSPVAADQLPQSVVVADFNGDGIADLAVGNFNGNNISILLGNGDGNFVPASGSPVAAGNNPAGLGGGRFQRRRYRRSRCGKPRHKQCEHLVGKW
jgi:FG-GAP-like repeat/Bacterial Ig-like domain (group 3)